jgi:transcription-repair coupling factor (superfamily II helicase)
MTQTVAPGEYSMRGGLIDLFPMGSALPFRIDLFDEEIEAIRTFDPDTQRSVYAVPEIRLLPAREFPFDEGGRSRFRGRFRETFEGDPSRSTVYKDVGSGIAPAGIEYYLPLFFDQTDTLFDYLSPEAVICFHGAVAESIRGFWRETESRHSLLKGDRVRPLLPPETLFLDEASFFSRAREFGRLTVHASGETPRHAAAESPPDVSVERRAEDPVGRLRRFVADHPGRLLLLVESAGRRETVLGYLAEHGIDVPVVESFQRFVQGEESLALALGPLSAGFLLLDSGIGIITENELYPTTARPRRKAVEGRRTSIDGWLRDLTELRTGDPVVHEKHGIGRYLGLARLDLGEGETEFLELEYADGDKLYVPVSGLNLIGRYSGVATDEVKLEKLGSGHWEKARRAAALQARDTAAELLALQATRAGRAGHAFAYRSHDLEVFADGFGFEETPDQRAAIEAVIADMEAGRPMDRLVCGDVGFGKTEVALRAAFVAVSGGRQVALLAPTTLLAEQHFNTFSDRFADWPIRIAELSRFRAAKEQSQVLAQLAGGTIDIVIGTHRLLQDDVRFDRLGLVIVDEEHRFGVRQKERLKALRAEVDVLTLTATPIPRTLSLALEGLREFSVIATAPQRRLAIKTFVMPASDGAIREACLREFKRGGQVYFLHNQVESIGRMRERLEKLLPEARIAVGHGQLPERELERVMREFTQQRANLLLCTTIIETGIDIATANTIVIDRADRFGLAQLHQLRGRVGRSHHQAYAYLMIDRHAKPTPQASKRLEAIQAMEELGSGFFLAMHDLEIRGAGEVLGESQSGQIQEIGFALYAELLQNAVRALKEGREPDLGQPLSVTSEINLHVPALLPGDYCSDVRERLTLYKRMANCEDDDKLQALREELIDRFGALPPQTLALIETHRLRILARPCGVERIDATEAQVQLQFAPRPPIEPAHVIAMVQRDANLRLAGPDRLVWKRSAPDLASRAAAVRELLARLQS